jgi:polyisoprenoid-binding protein YceI
MKASRPAAERAMKGPNLLHVARFPAIGFRSRQITVKQLSPGSYERTITGDFSLHGAVKATG